MSRQSKLFLMFLPFVLFFAALAFLVNDMRHPDIVADQCVVTATGEDVQAYKAQALEIYRQSDNNLNDVSLRCNRFGALVLNDTQLFITPVKSGQGAEVQRKQYHILPERWMVSVHTGPEKKK